MKTIKLSLISIVSACLFTPVLSQAADYEAAVKAANVSLNQAKAANYEWRDSRKLLEKADKLNQQGKTENAMQLVAQAKTQGEMAVAQAQLQSSVSGPR